MSLYECDGFLHAILRFDLLQALSESSVQYKCCGITCFGASFLIPFAAGAVRVLRAVQVRDGLSETQAHAFSSLQVLSVCSVQYKCVTDSQKRKSMLPGRGLEYIDKDGVKHK